MGRGDIMGEIVVPVADRGLFTFFARHSGESQNPGKPWTPAFILFILRVADPGLVTFLARPSKVTKRRPPLVHRACASPVLLDEFGGCGTRSRSKRKHIERARAQTGPRPRHRTRL